MWGNHTLFLGSFGLTSKHIASALKCGYTALDTATGYKNARAINQAIHDTGIHPIILTKFNPEDFKNNIQNTAIRHNKDLGREPDIVLLHSPLDNNKLNISAFKSLRSIYPGKMIGISNFDIKRIEDMIEQDCKPQIISLEFSPFYQPNKLVSFCKDNDIIITGYRPTYKGAIFTDEKIKNIVGHCNINVTNLVLQWITQKCIIPIVSSKNENNMRANLDFVNIILNKEIIDNLDKLNTNKSTCMYKYCPHDE